MITACGLPDFTVNLLVRMWGGLWNFTGAYLGRRCITLMRILRRCALGGSSLWSNVVALTITMLGMRN